MSYKPLDPYYKEFITANPTTGAAQNADSLPVATANHNGTDDATFVLTVTNIDTGRYKITGTIPNTYAAGDVVNVTVAATVNSVAGKACVDTYVLDSVRLANIATSTGVNLAQWLGGTPSALVNGDVQADVERWAAAVVNVLVSGAVQAQVVSYASGQDPGTYVLATPANKLATDSQGRVTVGTNADKTGYSLTQAFPANFAALAIDASGRVTLAPAGVDAIVVETGLNLRQAISIATASAAGTLSGATGPTVTIAGAGVATTRVSATVDSQGNRTAITLTPPP